MHQPIDDRAIRMIERGQLVHWCDQCRCVAELCDCISFFDGGVSVTNADVVDMPPITMESLQAAMAKFPKVNEANWMDLIGYPAGGYKSELFGIEVRHEPLLDLPEAKHAGYLLNFRFGVQPVLLAPQSFIAFGLADAVRPRAITQEMADYVAAVLQYR